MILAHVSDFHVSTFGESFHDRRHFVKRADKPFRFQEERFEVRWEYEGWRVLLKRNGRLRKGESTTLHLVDVDGYEHDVKLVGVGKTRDLQQQQLCAYAIRTHERHARTLARALPSKEKLEQCLAETPFNTNLRFIKAARQVIARNPHVILASGDITDNGDGYELVEAVFADWISQGRFLPIPGNHDRFLFPFRGAVRPVPTAQSKQRSWRSFAERVGLSVDPSGAWLNEIPESKTMVVGLDSCVLGQKRLVLQSGVIGESQLSFLRGIAQTSSWKNARLRLVAMHHHLVPLSYGVGRKFPTEMGMRLEDAVDVARVFNQTGIDVVMHGHRHVSESRQPPGCNFHILAAPSLSMGCHSGDAPSFWAVQLQNKLDWERIRLDMPLFRNHNEKNLVSI